MRAAPKTAEQWDQIVAAFRASGLKQHEFAKRHGIKPCTLQNRLYPRPKTRRRRAFVRVEIEPTQTTPERVELVLGGEVVLRCDRLPDPDYIVRLRQALVSC